MADGGIEISACKFFYLGICRERGVFVVGSLEDGVFLLFVSIE